MSVEGHLHDLTVADLLRLVCMRRRAALLTVISAGRSAVLAVDGGRVQHARQGTLEGEAAVVEVLGWSDGIFRVGNVGEDLPRNVFSPLTELLRRAAAGAESEADAAAPDAEVVTDVPKVDEARFDDELMDLIARLEREVARLEEPRVRQRGALALQVVEEILTRVLNFLERWSAPWTSAELRVLLERQAERTPGLIGAEVVARSLSLARCRGAERGQLVFFRSAAAGSVGLVTSLLYRLTPRFAAPERRVLWQETFDAFVADLTGALELCQP